MSRTFSASDPWRWPQPRRHLGGHGRGNPRNSHTSGRGITARSTGRLLVQWASRHAHHPPHPHPPDGPRTVYAAAMGSAWGEPRAQCSTPAMAEPWDHVLSLTTPRGARNDHGRATPTSCCGDGPSTASPGSSLQERQRLTPHDGGDNWVNSAARAYRAVSSAEWA